MTIQEIKQIFSELISNRNWYEGTLINRKQAFMLKNRFEKNDLSIGKIIEVLIGCGYKVEISK